MFGLSEYSLVAAIIPIAWAIYLKYTSGTDIQLHFTNLDYRTTLSIRNGSQKTLFVDEIICYKSRHKHYSIYSAEGNRSLLIDPGEETSIRLDASKFSQFVKNLQLTKNEPFSLRIKLYASPGVITTGWIPLTEKDESQYGYIFKNSPRAIVLKKDLNPTVSDYVNPAIAAIILACFFLSFLLSYDIMTELVVFEFFAILLFGPFTFINGFKNGLRGGIFAFPHPWRRKYGKGTDRCLS